LIRHSSVLDRFSKQHKNIQNIIFVSSFGERERKRKRRVKRRERREKNKRSEKYHNSFHHSIVTKLPNH
jgi:hypothetical protein